MSNAKHFLANKGTHEVIELESSLRYSRCLNNQHLTNEFDFQLGHVLTQLADNHGSLYFKQYMMLLCHHGEDPIRTSLTLRDCLIPNYVVICHLHRFSRLSYSKMLRVILFFVFCFILCIFPCLFSSKIFNLQVLVT